MSSLRPRLRLASHLAFPVALLIALPSFVSAQILSATFTNCYRGATQAPSNQLLNITRVYAQLDTDVQGSAAVGGDVGPGRHGVLRLVAHGETGIQSEGFSNETNYLATLIVETSILSFVPYSNQSSLCSAIVTAGQSLINNNLSAAAYPSPGGCPYGPGPIMIGYHVPLGAMGTDDEIYPLTTLSTRLRILDTSYPPLQLACVDVQATPYFYGNSPVESTKRGTSLLVYDLVLWLPVAIFVALLVVNVAGRFFAAAGITRREHEANMASSLTTKLRRPSSAQRMKEILLETAIGRTIIRSKSLTRFVTPGVGDLLAFYQWVALIGMCSVRWQGFAYPILSRVGWSMLLFNTTMVSPVGEHTDPARNYASYPPTSFSKYNNEDLFTTDTSPFYFNRDFTASNLLSLPSTVLYNDSRASSAMVYTSSDEVDGLASFAAMIGLRPQALFPNSMTWFAIILALTAVLTLVLPMLVIMIKSVLSPTRNSSRPSSVSTIHSASILDPEEEAPELDAPREGLTTTMAGRNSPSPNYSRKHSSANGPVGVLETPATKSHFGQSAKEETEDYLPALGSDQPSSSLRGLNHWWAGGSRSRPRRPRDTEHVQRSDDGSTNRTRTVRLWLCFFYGSVVRLVAFFHLPITIFSIYQLAHASTSSVITVVFGAIVFTVLSLGLPAFLVWRIKKSATRKLKEDVDTILAYGPIYNTYAQDSYTFAAVRFAANLIEGCVVGGAQSRGTVQVAVILAVEVVETLVTSIWLPWGDGAAQGPLQFILSVSRIITVVLLIVISPDVRLSFTARGWIGYVIVLIQAVIVLVALFVVLCKILELLLRVIWSIDFDDSRSSRSGGLFGVLRKKRVLGFGRRPARHGRHKSKATNVSTVPVPRSILQPDSLVRASADGRPQIVIPGAGGGFSYLEGTTSRPDRSRLLAVEGEEDDDEYIMSAWTSHGGHGADTYPTGYVPPGAYSAPQAAAGATGFSVVRGGRATDDAPYTLASNALPAGAAPRPSFVPHPSSSSSTSHHPFDHISRAIPPEEVSSTTRRARVVSQSAVVETFQEIDGEVSPTTKSRRRDPEASFYFDTSGRDARRMSAPLPASPGLGMPSRPKQRPLSGSAGQSNNWRRESSSGSAFFSNLFRGSSTAPGDDIDDWTDSDDSDDDGIILGKAKRKWPFAKTGRARKVSNDALVMQSLENERTGVASATHDPQEHLQEDEDAAIQAWQEQEAIVEPAADPQSSQPSTAKSFVVVRQNHPR